MKLQDALDQVRKLDDNLVIFARKPWSLNSDADIGKLDASFRVPKEMSDRQLEYFLGISVAREVLGVFGRRTPTVEECRKLLMYYAEYDAYPEWVYKSQ